MVVFGAQVEWRFARRSFYLDVLDHNPTFARTPRTTVRRRRDRATYDRKEVYEILDRGFVCHVCCVHDGGPVVIPTTYARRGDEILLHGAAGNHVLDVACDGGDLAISVTLVDGLVLARSTMHHSVNYRSVVVFGRGSEITDRPAKLDALTAIVDHVLPGRSADARSPDDGELRATRVVRVPLREVSAKIRTGPPVDDEEDLGLPVWAGVLPLGLRAGPAVQAPGSAVELPVPAYVDQPARWSFTSGRGETPGT